MRACVFTSIAIAVSFLAGGAAWAVEGAVPVAVAAKLFCKVITYDERLPDGVVRVGIVYPAAEAASGGAALGAFTALREMRVKGRSIEAVDLPYVSPDDVAGAAKRGGLYGLFVVVTTPDKDVPVIRGIAKKLGLLTFAHNPAQVPQGFAVGVRESSGNRVILLNPGVALEQRRKFEGGFLGACTIVGT